jgi:transcriptional regulator with XRE-family HTH domain
MTKSADDDTPSGFSVEVGRRLRAVRRGHRLSLDGVEHESGGRWTASAIGAYERGFRNLSLPRLHELALFYEVPTSALLSESGESGTPDVQATSRLVFDLEALGRAPDAAPISRYLQTIIVERGDFNGRVLSVRREDVRALCVIRQCTETELFETLDGWGALLSRGPVVEGRPVTFGRDVCVLRPRRLRVAASPLVLRRSQ